VSKCIKCHREATYDTPEDLCDLHWELWFTEEYQCTPEELVQIRIDDLEQTWEEYGRPSDADEIIEEVKKLVD